MRRIRISTLWMVMLCLAFGTKAALGGVIGVNFSGPGPNPFPVGPTDEPGIVPGANWNNVLNAGGSAIPLQDSTAAATTATLTFSAFDPYDGFSILSTANTATSTMYRAGIVGFTSAQVSIAVYNIPYALYDVYVYASADTTDTSLLSITDGTTTFYYASDGSTNAGATSLLLTTSTDPLNPTVGPAQYQIFKGLTSSSLSLLAAGSIGDTISNNVFGFQIVASTVPEPSSFTIFAGIALFGWITLGRRPSK